MLPNAKTKLFESFGYVFGKISFSVSLPESFILIEYRYKLSKNVQKLKDYLIA